MLSPVGATISGAHLRSRQRLMLARNHADYLLDILRYEAATEIFRPLAEALALFAEFDVRPGAGDYRSELFVWLVTLNGGAKILSLPLDAIDQHIASLLAEMRSTEELARKKENLLGRPLHIADGGYLLGYLGLKRLWNAYQDRWRNDAELFFGFVRALFFDDFGIVRAILDPAVKPEAIYSSILEAVRERVEFLFDSSVVGAVDRFNEAASNHQLRVPKGNALPWYGDVSLCEKGGALREQLMAEITTAQPGIDNRIGQFNAWTLANRERLCIFNTPADISVGEQLTAATIDGKRALLLPSHSEVARGAGAGSIQMYFSTTGRFYALLVTRNRQCVASLFSGQTGTPTTQLQQQYVEFAGDPPSLLHLRETQDENIEEFLRRQPIYEGLDAIRQLLALEVDDFYTAEWALRDIEEKQAADLKAKARDFGIYSVLESDTVSLQALAAAGLGRPISEWQSQIRFLEETSVRTGLSLCTYRSESDYEAI
jgi:hypothetical protein